MTLAQEIVTYDVQNCKEIKNSIKVIQYKSIIYIIHALKKIIIYITMMSYYIIISQYYRLSCSSDTIKMFDKLY